MCSVEVSVQTKSTRQRTLKWLSGSRAQFLHSVSRVSERGKKRWVALSMQDLLWILVMSTRLKVEIIRHNLRGSKTWILFIAPQMIFLHHRSFFNIFHKACRVKDSRFLIGDTAALTTVACSHNCKGMNVTYLSSAIVRQQAFSMIISSPTWTLTYKPVGVQCPVREL